MPAQADLLHWWRAPGLLERFIADLIDAEARLLRPGGPWPPYAEPAQLAVTALGEEGLGFDSLERLGLAAALSEALHLHRGGLADTLITARRLGGWVEAAAASLECFGALVTVRCLDHAGKRRAHRHPMARLEAEAAIWAGLLPGDRLRVRSAVASHDIHGLLFTLMLPARLGLPVDDLRRLPAAAVLAGLRPGDLVIGQPAFWDALLDASPSGWPPGVIGVASGASCPDTTAVGLGEAGLAALLDIYGSDEAGGIGWRKHGGDAWSDGTGAYRLLPCWRREADGLLSRDDGSPLTLRDRLDWDGPDRFRIAAGATAP